MNLYKYRACGQRTWELLLNRKLFFSIPERLNDPLDSSIDISAEYERARSIVNARDTHPEKRESFLMFLLEGSHKFHDEKTGEQIGLNQAMQRFIAQLGIFALSKNPTDALLWSHYADGHRGVCLGFDSDLLEIDNVFIKDNVDYQNQPPYVALFLQMVQELAEFVKPWEQDNSYPNERAEEFYTRQLSRLMRSNLLVKSNKWRYEEEYRLISTKNGYHEFSPLALREIIVGAKISKQDIETIKNIIKHPDYSHVVIRNVEIVSGSFDFKLSELQ